MTESKDPEGEQVRDEPPGAADSPAAEAPPQAAESSAQAAAPVAPPATNLESDDEALESVDVEAVTVEATRPAAARAPTHHPPPPPSIRAHGTGSRLHFEVTGTPRLAQDLMSRKIITIGPDDKLLHLEEHMEKFRFGHLPVIKDDKLVGLITHGDLLHASASFLTQKAKEIDEIIHNFPASRIMRRELVTVRPTDTLSDVAKLMWDRKVGCVLVTEEGDKLVGIITEGDFVRLAHHFLVSTQK